MVGAENVAYQGTLIQWFVHYCNELSIEGIHFVPITPRGLSKVSRILAYFKSLMDGSSMADKIPMAQLNGQAAFYKPTARKNTDDLLDVGAYGEQAFLDHSAHWLLPLDAEYEVVRDEPDTKYPPLMQGVRLPR